MIFTHPQHKQNTRNILTLLSKMNVENLKIVSKVIFVPIQKNAKPVQSLGQIVHQTIQDQQQTTTNAYGYVIVSSGT